MFVKLSWEKEADSSLDFQTCDGRSLVVMSETTGFTGDTYRDTSIGMHLLEHLVYIDGARLTPLLRSLLITLGDRFLSAFYAVLPEVLRGIMAGI